MIRVEVEDIESLLESMPADHIIWSATWRCVVCFKSGRYAVTTPAWSAGPPTCRCDCGAEMLAVDANVDPSVAPMQCYWPSAPEKSERN